MIAAIKIALLLALVPFSLSMLIDVCLGHPAKEEGADVKAIFFFFPFWLAVRRLKKYDKYEEFYKGFKPTLNAPDLSVKAMAKVNYKNAVFNFGKEFFTWEKGFGMCPKCTNIRIAIIFSLICIFIFHLSFLHLLLITCFSNLYLLIFNKIN